MNPQENNDNHTVRRLKMLPNNPRYSKALLELMENGIECPNYTEEENPQTNPKLEALISSLEKRTAPIICEQCDLHTDRQD